MEEDLSAERNAPDREIFLTGTHHTQTSVGVLPQAVELTSGRHHQEDTLQGCSQCRARKMSQVLSRLITSKNCLNPEIGNLRQILMLHHRHPLSIHRRMEMQNQGSLLKIGRFQEKETMVELDGTPVIFLSVAGYITPVCNQQIRAMLQDKRQYCASWADGDST